jgi:hypothetical protein
MRISCILVLALAFVAADAKLQTYLAVETKEQSLSRHLLVDVP